ncbi:hypothetical protein BpHYR1_015642, partial [Brachionus plicatilis]
CEKKFRVFFYLLIRKKLADEKKCYDFKILIKYFVFFVYENLLEKLICYNRNIYLNSLNLLLFQNKDEFLNLFW